MFWDACKEVLLLVCPSHDHKNSADIYASTTHSITNLITQATYILQDKIDSKEINEMPLISGIEQVRLQFIPNHANVKLAAKFVGRLGM